MDPNTESESLRVGLTLEDEFTLTRIRTKAHELHGPERDTFLWSMVFKLICRERAYKSVLTDMGVAMDTNMDLFDYEKGE